MYLFVRLLLLITLLTACDSKAVNNAINNKNWEHVSCDITVSKGETWRDIANLTGVSTSILKRHNNLKLVKRTSKILIPARKIHFVKKGETVAGIANKYGMTFSELIKLNDLQQPYSIILNQKIKIIEVTPSLKKILSKNKKPQEIKFNWPIKGKVIAKFGTKENGSQDNRIKILGRMHSPVKPTAAGVVVYVGNGVSSYGNLIIIQHANEWLSSYGNLGEIYVEKGTKVKSGKIIAKTDSTQLYFSLRKGNSVVNPLKYLSLN